MDRTKKLSLIERSLALRHKLKVHDSMESPETHEDLAIMLLARWELEDELRAIEEILATARQGNVSEKRDLIVDNILNDRPVKTKRQPKQGKPAKGDKK